MKVFNRETLIAACRASVKRGYNRQIDLTPKEEAGISDKIFPVIYSMVHEHIAGQRADPHVRCVIGLCANGGTATLDVDADVFDLLPEVEVPDA